MKILRKTKTMTDEATSCKVCGHGPYFYGETVKDRCSQCASHFLKYSREYRPGRDCRACGGPLLMKRSGVTPREQVMYHVKCWKDIDQSEYYQ